MKIKKKNEEEDEFIHMKKVRKIFTHKGTHLKDVWCVYMLKIYIEIRKKQIWHITFFDDDVHVNRIEF